MAHAVEGADSALLEQSTEPLVLAVGQPVDGLGPGRVVRLPLGQADSAAGEKGAHTLEPRPALDVLRIVRARIERRAQAPVARLRAGGEQLVQRPRPRLPVQAGASDEHVVQLEDARADGRRNPERPSGAPARQERLRELGRKTFVQREPAELVGRRPVLAVEMTLVGVELFVGEEAFLGVQSVPGREQRLSPLRAEEVELGAFRFPVGHTIRLQQPSLVRIREGRGRRR